jgi:hypothetical protein
MSKQGLVRLLPRDEVQDPQGQGEVNTKRWIGRIAIFELSTGTRVQGQILGMSDEWIDTDNGAVRVDAVVHAKWVSAEEASIIRNNRPLLGGRGW